MRKSEDNEITRRRFLRLTSAGLAASSLALAGCGPEPTATEAPAAAQATATSPPEPTAPPEPKVLRYSHATPAQPQDTLDPAVPLTRGSTHCAIYDQLTVLDDGFVPHPALAESWDSDDEAKVWTFKLRQDVTFHDGTPFTAKDVVYSYRRILDPETASPSAAVWSGIDSEGIEAVDDYTVRFTLPEAIVNLPQLLNDRSGWIVKEGSTHDDLHLAAVGTGPFKVESFTPGEDPYTFVKNENYWQAGAPKIDELLLRGIDEATSRVAALERGEADVIDAVPWLDVPKLEANSDITVISQRSPYWLGMVMKCDVEPFTDNRVRQAFKYVMDRQQMLELVLQGYGQVANDVPVAPWVEYGIDEPARQQDYDKAKALLAEAGYPDGLNIELHTSTTMPQWPEMATVFKEMAAPAGINVDIRMGPADVYWTEVWMKVPFCCTFWAGRPADGILSVAFMSTSEWNESFWNRPDFDELIVEARRTVEYDKRTELYQQAQRMVVEDGGVLVPFFVDTIVATQASVEGFVPTARHGIFYDFTDVDIKA